MASLGHPIVGDERYSAGPGVDPELIFAKWLARGMYLWALELRFRHPATGEPLRFEIEQPEKFEGVIGKKPRRRRAAAGEAAGEGSNSADSGASSGGACVGEARRSGTEGFDGVRGCAQEGPELVCGEAAHANSRAGPGQRGAVPGPPVQAVGG